MFFFCFCTTEGELNTEPWEFTAPRLSPICPSGWNLLWPLSAFSNFLDSRAELGLSGVQRLLPCSGLWAAGNGDKGRLQWPLVPEEVPWVNIYYLTVTILLMIVSSKLFRAPAEKPVPVMKQIMLILEIFSFLNLPLHSFPPFL